MYCLFIHHQLLGSWSFSHILFLLYVLPISLFCPLTLWGHSWNRNLYFSVAKLAVCDDKDILGEEWVVPARSLSMQSLMKGKTWPLELP